MSSTRHWKNFKCYQITGIIFGLLHILLAVLFFTTHEGGIGIAYMDFPLTILADNFFPSILYNNVYFYYFYALIPGTALYCLIGMIIGFTITKIKGNKS